MKGYMWTMPVAHCLLVWICRYVLTPHHGQPCYKVAMQLKRHCRFLDIDMTWK